MLEMHCVKLSTVGYYHGLWTGLMTVFGLVNLSAVGFILAVLKKCFVFDEQHDTWYLTNDVLWPLAQLLKVIFDILQSLPKSFVSHLLTYNLISPTAIFHTKTHYSLIGSMVLGLFDFMPKSSLSAFNDSKVWGIDPKT